MKKNFVEEKGLGYWRKRFKEVETEAYSFISHWKEIVDYFVPRKGRYLNGDSDQHNDGRKKHDKIINGSSSGALRTLAAGMQGGLTSPSRPWFNLRVPNESLVEVAAVRDWLHKVRQKMLHVFASSNFYVSIHNLYKELGAFGVCAMIIDKDLTETIRCRPFTIGEYFLSLDKKCIPDELFTRYEMTAKQLVAEFGDDNMPDTVMNAFKNNKETYFKVNHIITPNEEYVEGAKGFKGNTYVDIHYLAGSGEIEDSSKDFLRIKGYLSKPFIAARWDVTGIDTYGDSPAMEALADNKMLQDMEIKKLKALGKMINPAMNAPSSMRKQGGTIVEGGINYIDPSAGNQSFTPAYQVRPETNIIAAEIREVENRIKDFFYHNLFLAVIQSERGQMTAYEVSKRIEEKITMLGPIIERIQTEMLDPIIDRVYYILEEEGGLPEIPEELQGVDFKPEYISMLAQAQKQVGTSAILQIADFAANMSKLNPDSLDKFDTDEAIDQYADMVGGPPSIVRSDDVVAEMRQRKAEAQKQALMREMMAPAARATKDMASAKMDTGSALDGFMGDGENA